MFRIVLLLSIFLFSCKSSKVEKKGNQINNCKLISKEFGINKETFKYFKSEIALFLNKNNDFDILKIYSSGGNNKEHLLKRWYVDRNNRLIIKSIVKGEEVVDFDVNYEFNNFKKLFLLIEDETMMQVCPYNSNNDTYALLIKEKGKFKFKFISTSSNYSVLNKKEKSKILGVLNFINYLENKDNR